MKRREAYCPQLDRAFKIRYVDEYPLIILEPEVGTCYPEHLVIYLDTGDYCLYEYRIGYEGLKRPENGDPSQHPFAEHYVKEGINMTVHRYGGKVSLCFELYLPNHKDDYYFTIDDEGEMKIRRIKPTYISDFFDIIHEKQLPVDKWRNLFFGSPESQKTAISLLGKNAPSIA